MTAPTAGICCPLVRFRLVTTGSRSQSYGVFIEHPLMCVNGTKDPVLMRCSLPASIGRPWIFL